ncbi:MAG: hypothetical protein D6742_11685 [Cyanobacteria bacterium J069]|nr:MAG: hypothetical protein D6742_11685 [Cyanobacteria bacterium J069]
MVTLVVCLVCVHSAPAHAQTTLSSDSRVQLKGIGPVRVGMTVNEAKQAAGVPLVRVENAYGEEGDACYSLSAQGVPGLGFMVTDGRIARVEVGRESSIKTLSGAGIGSTEAQIQQLYPGQIVSTPHEYFDGGKYLTFIPKDEADKTFRVIFETDKGRVIEYRAGKLPEVQYIEGCA